MASLPGSSSKYIVFSYHKNHEELVLKIYHDLKNKNLPVWIDTQDGINKNIYQSTDRTTETISSFVCFMTPMYEASKRCQQEVAFAKSEGIPIIGCRLLPNWKPSGWLNKITSDLLIIDLRDLNQKNFEDKIKKLQQKLIWLLDNDTNFHTTSGSSDDELLIDRSIFFEDSHMISLGEKVHVNNYLKKQPIQYRMLPNHCRLYLSNLMITNNEYILINADNHLHLFDKNLKLIRSNNHIKINENDLKDLSWCSDSNSFIILMRKQVYLMNPLTCKLSIIENMKLNDHREEFISCSCSEEKFFIITCELGSKTFYFQEYNLPTFRFFKKLRILDFIGTSLFIQNGIFNKCDIQQIISIRYFQQKVAIIMEIASNWYIYIFNLLNEQPTYLTGIHLDGKSRMTILNPNNQWIIFKDYLSNSFIQMSIDFQKKFDVNEQNELSDYSKGFIDFGGQLRSVALFGTSNLVLLVDNTLVLYKL